MHLLILCSVAVVIILDISHGISDFLKYGRVASRYIDFSQA
jgi:hypothetical protein